MWVLDCLRLFLHVHQANCTILVIKAKVIATWMPWKKSTSVWGTLLAATESIDPTRIGQHQLPITAGTADICCLCVFCIVILFAYRKRRTSVQIATQSPELDVSSSFDEDSTVVGSPVGSSQSRQSSSSTIFKGRDRSDDDMINCVFLKKNLKRVCSPCFPSFFCFGVSPTAWHVWDRRHF